MTEELSLKETQSKYHGTLKSYTIGFISSLILTGIAFLLVSERLLTGDLLIYSIIALALIQAAVQLLCFLHLGQEEKPRWETFIFSCMMLVLLIIVGGTLWIMHDLRIRVMSPMSMEMTHD